MVKYIAGMLAALIFFTGCGASAGEIYDKDYIPPETTTTWVQDYMWVCDGAGNCQNKPMGGHWEDRTEPECYQVKFRNESGDEGSDCVSPGEYDDLEVGDWYEK